MIINYFEKSQSEYDYLEVKEILTNLYNGASEPKLWMGLMLFTSSDQPIRKDIFIEQMPKFFDVNSTSLIS